MDNGFFDNFGGAFVPETLIPALRELQREFARSCDDQSFQQQLTALQQSYSGRPTPLYFAANLSKQLGLELYLKREDLLHTGAHKINNTLGQCLLSKRMGKNRIIAETGAGQHGVATAAAAALLKQQCLIYMGAADGQRQQPNLRRMQLLGAEVKLVEQGSATLKDAVNAALQDWVTNVQDTHYLLGSVTGPQPFPQMVAYFQRIIGTEVAQQLAEIGPPAAVIACVGGGSNAIGIFQAFLQQPEVRLIGVEAGGHDDLPGNHARTLALGSSGIFQGSYSYLLQDDQGNVAPVHSVSAGLDYPGVGPQHAALHESGRVLYSYARDAEALAAFRTLSSSEGIIPAIESAHALAYLIRERAQFAGQRVVVNLSGRGDKDLEHYFKVTAGGG